MIPDWMLDIGQDLAEVAATGVALAVGVLSFAATIGIVLFLVRAIAVWLNVE